MILMESTFLCSSGLAALTHSTEYAKKKPIKGKERPRQKFPSWHTLKQGLYDTLAFMPNGIADYLTGVPGSQSHYLLVKRWAIRIKGQIKPKADLRAVDSPKKRTNKFVLFAFLLFMAKNPNSFVCFFGESMARPNCFWFYLTFT